MEVAEDCHEATVEPFAFARKYVHEPCLTNWNDGQ